MIFKPQHLQNSDIQGKKVLTLIFDCSWKVFFYRNHNPRVSQNSVKWEKTFTVQHLKPSLELFAAKACTPSRECFVNMTKLHHLTKLHHHMLYHVSHVDVWWHRTALRRRRTFHTVLLSRGSQVLPWRTSTYGGIRRPRTRSVIIGLCNDRCLSQDYQGQRKIGLTTAYVDSLGVLGPVLRCLNMLKTSVDNLRLHISRTSTLDLVKTASRRPVVDLA